MTVPKDLVLVVALAFQKHVLLFVMTTHHVKMVEHVRLENLYIQFKIIYIIIICTNKWLTIP